MTVALWAGPAGADGGLVLLDWVVDTTGAVADDSIRQAVVDSLFTWRRDPDDEEGRHYGWWADTYGDGVPIGSYLWRVARMHGADAARAAERYAVEALQWMVADGVATGVTAAATIVGHQLRLTVTVARAAGADVRWAALWEAIR
jgi:phage gp46-like protein